MRCATSHPAQAILIQRVTLLRWIPVLLLCAVPAFPQGRAPATHRLPLRTVHEVFGVSKAEASKTLPIELQAVVTYSDPQWGILFIRDRTDQTFVDVHGNSTLYRLGTLVRVEAVTGTNAEGPTLTHAKVFIVGTGTLPKAEPMSVAAMQDGLGESHLVVTEGMLHPCEHDTGRVCFRICDGKKQAWLSVPQPDSPAAQSLMGAMVRVSGVLGRYVDDEKKRLGAQLYVASLDNIKVETSSLPVSVSSAPIPIRDLRASEADERFVRQFHVRGTVTWQSPGLFSIDDNTGTLFIGTRKDVLVHQGSTVDVIGFPNHGEFGLELSDSTVKPAAVQSHDVAIAPLPVTAAETLKRSLNGRRVRIRARLIDQRSNATEFVYQLDDGVQRFTAVLLRDEGNREIVGLSRNSTLELTGVAVIQSGTSVWPESLLVLIDSPAAMVVQSENGWLTLRYVLGILGGMGICVIATLVWVSLLRRTVHKQTATIRARLEIELQLETKYRRLFERNLAAVYSWRPDGTIVDCNLAFARLLGLKSREQLIGHSYWELQTAPKRREQLLNALKGEALSKCQASLRRDDGVDVFLLENITPVSSADGVLYETTAIDVTQLRRHEAELQRTKDAAVFESIHDPLTGLPNRRILGDEVEALLAKARLQSTKVAMLYIDLDGFKLVNDSLGHTVGDALLVQVADCLRSWVRDGDLLARLGGDEFLVILNRLPAREDAALMGENLLDAISDPFRVEGHDLSIGASIGISIFPDNASDAEELMRQADSAMYAAKREGKNRVLYFNPEIGSRVHERSSLENLLRGAIARREISVQYQPEFEVTTRRLIRFEALARWTHPTLGRIPPDKFIPIAEESGLIVSLGAYIMNLACSEAVRWQSIMSYPIQVAVNVSSIQFRNKGFVEEVGRILEHTGLRPELLQIELTESVMLGDDPHAAETMNLFRAMGIGLAIDDFGTGYSSLSYLPTLPFDALKIDRSFVMNMDTQPESEPMIRLLVALAHNVGMRVVVEGVETQDQMDLIGALGANEVQGYLMGRPSADPIRDFLMPAAEASTLQTISSD
jgi:diguanylate cyclase (GGDEF)-like protein/PAS domain S-box-containing protein